MRLKIVVTRPPTVSTSVPSAEARLERLLEPVEAEPASHEHGPVGLDDDRLGLDVVLVLDLADELFDDVLDRDQARRASVLVDDHRQRSATRLQLLQKLCDPLGFRHQQDGTNQGLQGRLGGALVLDQVVDRDDAGDVVEVLLEDGDATVHALLEGTPQVGDGAAGGDGLDVRTGRHDLANLGLREAHQGARQPRLVDVVDGRRWNLRALSAPCLAGIAPRLATPASEGPAQGPDERRQRLRVQVEHGHQPQQRALGVGADQRVGQRQPKQQQEEQHHHERREDRPVGQQVEEAAR